LLYSVVGARRSERARDARINRRLEAGAPKRFRCNLRKDFLLQRLFFFDPRFHFLRRLNILRSYADRAGRVMLRDDRYFAGKPYVGSTRCYTLQLQRVFAASGIKRDSRNGVPAFAAFFEAERNLVT